MARGQKAFAIGGAVLLFALVLDLTLEKIIADSSIRYLIMAATCNVAVALSLNVINGLAGNDVIEASGLGAGAIQLTADGGDGDDILLGSLNNDVLLGGAGDDVLIGGGGIDVLDPGPGDNVVINSFAAPLVASMPAPLDHYLI